MQKEFASDIRILSLELIFTREKARTPLKFGGVVMMDTLFCKCRAMVENRKGKVAEGWGGIFLSDVWAWPSPIVPHEQREEVMRRFCIAYAKSVESFRGYAHPIDIFLETEKEFPKLSREVSLQVGTAEEMPLLGALVCASPVDAALHDAFGNVNGIDSYLGYGQEFMRDLSFYLGDAFKGKFVADYLQSSYSHEVPVFHLVGGLDKLTRSELTEDDPNDGLPNCLEDWVAHDGMFCLKVKLRGNDLDWDLQRLLDVYRIGLEGNRLWKREQVYLTADTNEMCDSPDYMVELLCKLKERNQKAFDSLLYVEQPTHRDLKRHPFDMRKLAQLKPVFMDESLTDWEMYELGRQLGMTGIALKTCKGHSLCLLMAAKATKDGMLYSIQDLTNPSIALLHSVGMAARLRPVMGSVEANSRQFFPKASEAERQIHPDITERRGGVAKTNSLIGTGLGYQIERLKPFWEATGKMLIL